MIGEEGFGEGIATRLFNEIVQATPSHVTVPSDFDVTHHLMDSGALEKGGRHRVRTIKVSHQAVADRQVHLGIGRADLNMFASRIHAKNLAGL